MQSVTKTVSSIIVGIAITRGDFKAERSKPLGGVNECYGDVTPTR